MAQITERNTKKEILEALHEKEQEIAKLKSSKYNPEEEIKKKSVETTLKKADEAVSKNIFNQEIFEEFNSLKEAIKIKKAELQELYDIEVGINTLAATIEANNTKMAEFDAEFEVKVQKSKEEITRLEEQYADKMAELQQKYSETQEAIKKERERESEEYNYKKTRDRQKENDSWEDEKANREAIMQLKEAELAKRESAIADSEKEIADLKKQVEQIPELLETKIAEATEKAIKDIKAQHAIEKNVIKREAELDNKLLSKELESIKAQYDQLLERNESLEHKLEDANARVQSIASDAVKSARPTILNNEAK